MRRSREQITASILNFCSARSRTVSQVMLSQNLSHRELKSQLEVLIPSKLVSLEQKGKKRVIRTTRMGVTALRCYRNAIALLKGETAPFPLLVDRSPSFEIDPNLRATNRSRRLTQNLITEQ